MKLLVRLRRLACRNQPGEKSEFRIAGRPMPSRREGKLPCQGHPNTSKEKRTRRSTLKLRSARPKAATARKGLLTRFYDALIEARMRQAMRELAIHRHLMPENSVTIDR